MVDAAGSLVERVVYGPFGKSQHHFAGDVNGDGVVDFPGDAQTILDLGSRSPVLTIGDAEYQPDADLNYDGQIDFWDIQLVLNDVGKTATGISRSLDAGGPGNPVGYAGYFYIDDFGGSSGDFGLEGHWYARHRYYDPVAGRWITRDPAGYVDGMSLYLYVGGNPFAYVDPLGLRADPVMNGLASQFVTSVADAARRGLDEAATRVQEATGFVGGVKARMVEVVANDAIDVVEGVVQLGLAAQDPNSIAARIAVEKVENPSAPSPTLHAVKEQVVTNVTEYGKRVLSGDPEAIGDGLRTFGYGVIGEVGFAKVGSQGVGLVDEVVGLAVPSHGGPKVTVTPKLGEPFSVGPGTALRDARRRSGVLSGEQWQVDHVRQRDASGLGDDGPAILLPAEMHRRTRTYGRQADQSVTPRQDLARDIIDRRQLMREAGIDRRFTNQQMKALIMLNKNRDQRCLH